MSASHSGREGNLVQVQALLNPERLSAGPRVLASGRKHLGARTAECPEKPDWNPVHVPFRVGVKQRSDRFGELYLAGCM